MNSKINKIFVICSLFSYFTLQADALVYNVKIRRTLEIATDFNENKKTNFIASIIPVISNRTRHIVDKELEIDVNDNSLIGGSLFNLRYWSKPWWVEATTGLEKERVKVRGTSSWDTSRTGFDDILLSGGYTNKFGNRTQLTFYGLIGFPTITKVNEKEIFDTLVGTRFKSIGAGAEIAYIFLKQGEQSVMGIMQIRTINFFNRYWSPILEINERIQPGQLTDLLLVIQHRRKTALLEIIYNPSFYTNQAVLLHRGKIKSPNYVRNSVDATITKYFPHAISLTYGISLGKAKRYSATFLKSWLNFSIAF